MFREKESLLHEGGDERDPLIQNPIIFARSHDFPMDPYRFGRVQKKQRFQWLLFFGITMFSFVLLVLFVATMLRLADDEIPIPIGPGTDTPRTPTTTPSPSMISSKVTEILMNMTSTMLTSTASTTTASSTSTISPVPGV